MKFLTAFCKTMLFAIVMSAVAFFNAFFIVLLVSWRRRKASVDLNGRYVLITDCDSGIGRETAIRLDKMGVCVLATCLTKEGEQSLRSVTSRRLKIFQLDVSDSQQIQEVFCKVKELLDGKSGKIFSFFFCYLAMVNRFSIHSNNAVMKKKKEK